MFPNCCLFVSCKNTLSSLFIHIWYYHLNCYTATGILWVMGPTAFTSPDAFLLPNIVWVNLGAQLNVSIPPYIDVEPMNTRPAVEHASTCSTTAPVLHNDADMLFFFLLSTVSLTIKTLLSFLLNYLGLCQNIYITFYGRPKNFHQSSVKSGKTLFGHFGSIILKWVPGKFLWKWSQLVWYLLHHPHMPIGI